MIALLDVTRVMGTEHWRREKPNQEGPKKTYGSYVTPTNKALLFSFMLVLELVGRHARPVEPSPTGS